jgi:hypothetical protein
MVEAAEDVGGPHSSQKPAHELKAHKGSPIRGRLSTGNGVPLVPLKSFPRAPISQMNGLLFAMSDGKKTVSVLVTHEALEDISSPNLTRQSYRETA